MGLFLALSCTSFLLETTIPTGNLLLGLSGCLVGERYRERVTNMYENLIDVTVLFLCF